jgi:hypothetical protein
LEEPRVSFFVTFIALLEIATLSVCRVFWIPLAGLLSGFGFDTAYNSTFATFYTAFWI